MLGQRLRPAWASRSWAGPVLTLLLSAVLVGYGPAAATPASVHVAASTSSSSAELSTFSYVRAGIRLARTALPAPRPGERVLLSLEASSGKLSLTRSQLLALPTVRFSTQQPQLKRTFSYEGVPLRDLAQLGGFAGKDLRVYASNGFMTVIRAADYQSTPLMLAHTADGKPIPVLEKGPLTVVLPSDPEHFPARLFSRYWVWFVERITPAP